MKQFTNLNIVAGPGKVFNYLVEFRNNTHSYIENYFSYYKYNESKVIIYNDSEINLNRNLNTWDIIPYDAEKIIPITNPEHIDLAEVILYFPRYAVETYHPNTLYSLCLKTWINGVEVILGNYLIKRTNALATKTVKIYNNIEYFECIAEKIIDPWDLQYSDVWKEWRQTVCKEKGNMNNTGSNLFIELEPIELYENYFVKKAPYKGCSNSVLLSNNVSNFMSANISYNFLNTATLNPGIELELKYNDQYNKDINGFFEYLQETYQTVDPQLTYELVIKDDNNIYKYNSIQINDIQTSFTLSEIGLTNWDEWRDGMKFNAIVTVTDQGNNIIELHSNSLDITPEVFKFLVNDCEIKNINLDDIDMKIYNVNVVNKIQKNVIQVDRPNDYKANIIKPIFFKVNDLSELKLHSGMTENICINLDEYKNKIDVFYLRIDGILFNEIGRTSAGVVFKIVNNKIKTKSGNYYLLDNNLNMITSGKYKTE